MTVNKDFFLNSRLSMTDWFLNWVDAYKQQTYPNGWQKEIPLWLKKTPKRNCPKTLQPYKVSTDDVENTITD